MWLRNITLVMIVYCMILVSIFSLAGLMYDFWTYLIRIFVFFVFGTAYCLAVAALSLQHDLLPRGRLIMWCMALCTAVPTWLVTWALYIMAVG